MLYRHWQPLVEGEGLAIEQLVLPVVVRRTVMTVAHKILLAGHMGKKWTVQRVLQRSTGCQFIVMWQSDSSAVRYARNVLRGERDMLPLCPYRL